MKSSHDTIKAVILALICLTSIPASAASVAKIIYYGAPPNAPENAFIYQENKEPQEVMLKRNNFSASFDISSGPTRLVLLPAQLPEDTPIPKTAPIVEIPEGWDKVLILVFEDQTNPIIPIACKAINASDNVFGPGELLFINFSDVAIFGLVGDKKLLCKPNTTSLISKPIEEKGSYIVKLDSVVDTVESRRWLVRQKWKYLPSARFMVFIMPLPEPRVAKLYVAPIWDF